MYLQIHTYRCYLYLPFNPLTCHPDNITANPSDVSALLGAVVTFQCRYSGVLPIWDVFIRVGSSLPSDPTETLTPEEVEILQPEGYLNHTSSEGGVSTLEVLATRELNNSQFQCRILVSSQIRSAPATLTVDGESVDFPLPPCVKMSLTCTHSAIYLPVHVHRYIRTLKCTHLLYLGATHMLEWLGW